MVRTPAVTLCALLFASASGGCDDLSEFRGKFDGAIVEGNFVRRCFGADTTATLVFDPEHAVGGDEDVPVGERNRITTSDHTFEGTLLEPIQALPNDPLSELTFPGPRRLRNYLLLARPQKGPLAGRDATVVVSLLADERLEVRIIGRTAETTTRCAAEGEADTDAGVGTDEPRIREYFGLFRMKSQ